MADWMKVTLLYLLAALLMAFPFKAAAFNDYDVDWTSENSKESILRITIDNCTTKFKMKNEDVEKLKDNPKALTDAVKKAIERANSGCKGN